MELAHEGHQGVTKTTNLLRNRVWFPRIDKSVKDLINTSTVCSMNTKTNPEPLKMTDCDTQPWTKIAADFFGPLPDGSEILILKDTHSKMVLAEEVKSTSSQNVLPVIDSAISLIGKPAKIKTDNGPPFNGYEFKEFCEVFGIEHTPITPLHPEANGQCEEFMTNMNKIVKNARNGDRSWISELNAFLRNNRTTPHSSTGVAPSDLIFRNSNSSKLPKLLKVSNNEHKKLIAKALLTNEKANETIKKNADKRRKAKTSDFKLNDLVLLNQIKNKKIHNKYLDRLESKQYKVTAIQGSMITIEDESNRSITREASWIKKGRPVINCKTSERLTVLESNGTVVSAVQNPIEVNAVQNPLEVQIHIVPITIPVEPIKLQTAQ
jgi:hypothetical protein